MESDLPSMITRLQSHLKYIAALLEDSAYLQGIRRECDRRFMFRPPVPGLHPLARLQGLYDEPDSTMLFRNYPNSNMVRQRYEERRADVAMWPSLFKEVEEGMAAMAHEAKVHDLNHHAITRASVTWHVDDLREAVVVLAHLHSHTVPLNNAPTPAIKLRDLRVLHALKDRPNTRFHQADIAAMIAPAGEAPVDRRTVGDSLRRLKAHNYVDYPEGSRDGACILPLGITYAERNPLPRKGQ